MLTSFYVRCPHAGCGWRGSVMPKGNAESWRGAVPGQRVVVLECPECQREWQAKVVGDDLVPLPAKEAAAFAI